MERIGLSASILKSDFRASIVVFLVALPLAMGISIASGYPPAAGLITGIVGGILVGLLSGAPLQVSGAAAGLTVLVYQGVQQFGLERMGLVILLAGIMQIAAALAGLGRWFQAISPTVLHAMLAGIGILILAGQFHVMLDLTPKGSGIDNISAIPAALAKTFSFENRANIVAFGLGVLSIGLMVFWPKIARGNLKLIPAPLVAVLACAVVASTAGLSVSYVSIPGDLMSTIADDLTNTLNLKTMKLFSLAETPALLATALQLALIASAESLLCAAAVDQLHSGARARFNKELAAQGIGNAICGMLGALPLTGVIVRSSANLNAGAKTRLSAILHGVWLLLFVWLLPEVLRHIPVAALAGILVFTGAKLLNPPQIQLLYRYGKSELFIYAATVAVIVAYDLLFGVILGLALSSLKLLRQLSHLSISVQPDPDLEKKFVVNLGGAATFLRLPKLVRALEKIPAGAHVEINADVGLMDPACIEHLNAWRERHAQSGGLIEINGQHQLRFV